MQDAANGGWLLASTRAFVVSVTFCLKTWKRATFLQSIISSYCTVLVCTAAGQAAPGPGYAVSVDANSLSSLLPNKQTSTSTQPHLDAGSPGPVYRLAVIVVDKFPPVK